jgi:hypothetical protein
MAARDGRDARPAEVEHHGKQATPPGIQVEISIDLLELGSKYTWAHVCFELWLRSVICAAHCPDCAVPLNLSQFHLVQGSHPFETPWQVPHPPGLDMVLKGYAMMMSHY